MSTTTKKKKYQKGTLKLMDHEDLSLPLSTTKLFVGSIPYSLTREDLSDLFAPYGALTWAFVAHKGSKAKGFGFVRFKEPEHAQMACKDMDGRTVYGSREINGVREHRVIEVKFTRERTEKKDKKNKEIICHLCNESGHIAPHCPKKRIRKSSASGARVLVAPEKKMNSSVMRLQQQQQQNSSVRLQHHQQQQQQQRVIVTNQKVERKHQEKLTPRKKRVTVIIPSYNRYTMLLRAIDSVKRQTVFEKGWCEREIIVINDASSQQAYYNQHNRDVIMIHLPDNSNKRPGVVRNVGLRLATGDYVAFLDDDDVWMAGKLEAQLKMMHANKCGMSCTTAAYVKQDSGNLEIPKIYTTLPSILEAKDLVSQNPVVCSSVVLSRNAIRNLFFSTSTYAEDYGLWKEVMKHTNCAVVQQVHVHLSSGNNGDSASERAVQRSALNNIFSTSASPASTSLFSGGRSVWSSSSSSSSSSRSNTSSLFPTPVPSAPPGMSYSNINNSNNISTTTRTTTAVDPQDLVKSFLGL